MCKWHLPPPVREAMEQGRVKDAAKDRILTVRAMDVAGAVVKAHDKCVIANACRRQLKLQDVYIYKTRLYTLKPGSKTYIRYILPRAALFELMSFDRGMGFSPDDYVLKAPKKGDRLGHKKRGAHSKSGKENPNKKRKYHHVAGIRGAWAA